MKKSKRSKKSPTKSINLSTTPKIIADPSQKLQESPVNQSSKKIPMFYHKIKKFFTFKPKEREFEETICDYFIMSIVAFTSVMVLIQLTK